MVHYESKGLFVGLISYPFNVDGADLYREVLEKLFQQHKKEYIDKLVNGNESPSLLYKPAAYRMFGSNGLAIISLMDEYAFGSRIFNPNHVNIDSETADNYQYKCVALTGSSEQFVDDKPYLVSRANDTFLRLNNRYPFIGIIRIKLECRLLFSHGIDITRATKEQIELVKDNLLVEMNHRRNDSSSQLESIIVDSYDSDELLVVAFANSFRIIDSFFKGIRRMKAQELRGITWGDDLKAKHICTACHMSFGYDINFSFDGSNNSSFRKWEEKDDIASDNDDWLYGVQCIVEPNPGHQSALCEELRTAHLFTSLQFPIEKTITGGSVIKFRIALKDVEALHIAVREENGIQGHIRRIKLVLESKSDSVEDYPADKDFSVVKEKPLVSEEEKQSIKELLRLLGVSKITRERALALIDLLNDCGKNPLQQVYFTLLKPAVENLETILKDFYEPDKDMRPEDIQSIESQLNAEINALEVAVYNRMYNKMTPNAVLEYGGGIQQFLQAFGHAFKELVRVFCPEMGDRQYLIISGAVKEFSIRTHTELNINHFLYPQLFCLTSWKEASNYTLQVLDKYEKRANYSSQTEEKLNTFKLFREFLSSNKALHELRQYVLSSISLPQNDYIYHFFERHLDSSFISYTLQDYLIYHFAFQRKFGLMWRVYWKAFLQTSSCYSQRGVIHREDFLYLMLRLLMVAFREKNEERGGEIDLFLKTARSNPLDPLLIPLWVESFDRLFQIAEKTCAALSSYQYQVIGDELIGLSEGDLLYKEKDGEDNELCSFNLRKNVLVPQSIDLKTIEAILSARESCISKLIDGFKKRSVSFDDFDETNPTTPNNVICLMSAFIRAVDMLDCWSASVSINALPRDEKGEIEFDTIKELQDHLSGILADPIGGFLTTKPQNREIYFVYRTILYRTLWDLSYRSLKV